MCSKLLLYNLVYDPHLGKLYKKKYVLLIQPWVKSKRSVCVLLNACHETILLAKQIE